MAELGRRISLSPPAVAERVQRLERTGVITGYQAVLDPKAIGYPIAAVVRVRPASRQLQKIPEIARATPEVVECYRITGEDCFFLKLHLTRWTTSKRSSTASSVYGQTTTSIIHSAPVSKPAAPASRKRQLRLRTNWSPLDRLVPDASCRRRVPR